MSETTDWNSMNGRTRPKRVTAETWAMIERIAKMRGPQIRREHEAAMKRARRERRKTGGSRTPYAGGVPAKWERTVTEYQPARPEVG